MGATTETVKTFARPEGTLNNVITYLCFTCEPISTRKIMKLTYLVDVYHFQLYGKPLTDARYYHWNYGVFSTEVYRSLEELYAQGIIQDRRIQTKTGHEAILPTPKVPKAQILLSHTGMQALKQVVEDWGSAMPEEIVSYTKQYLPFLNTDKWLPIDLERSDPIQVYADEHQIDPSEAATLDIIADEELTKSVLRAEEEMQRGRLHSYEDVFGGE